MRLAAALLLLGLGAAQAEAAALTWFLTNTVSTGQVMSETSPGADATTSPNVGWTVAKIAAGRYSPLDSGVEQASGTFVTSPIHPDGTIATATGDFFRTETTYSGDFAAAAWTFNVLVIAVSSGNDQDGNIGVRLHRSANADCSAATQITAARVEGAVVTNLTTGTAQNSSGTFSPGAFSVSNEYLCLEVGWEITGAAGANTRDVILRIGTNSTRLISADFTAAAGGGAVVPTPGQSRGLMGVGE